MKIVIDIDECVYEDAMNNISNGLCKYSNEAIRNGIPLPKGHGDLIDRNVVYSEFDKADLSRKELIGKMIVFGVPTVIPADK